MKTIAEVAYHLAFHNAFQSFLQIQDPLEEDDVTFEFVNCIQKEKCNFENVATLNKKYDIIHIVTTKNTKRTKLHNQIDIAEKKLNKGGAILFNYANANQPDDAECWQEVARLRCKENSFICVIPQVAQCCAVYRPGQRSHLYAAQHLSQYDEFEYLQSNRALLLNIISNIDFLVLTRFI